MATRKNLQITPSNVTSTGKISFRNGQPVVQFIIGESDMSLIGSSVRLCGYFRVRGNDTNSNSIPQNASNIRMSEQLGMFSIIDQLVIKSQATHQVIEEIKNYNRFMTSYLPVTSSTEDSIGHLSQQALVLPNFQAQKIGVVDIPTGNPQSGTSANAPGNAFCIHLPCGLFNGRVPIPLMPNGEGGLGGVLVEVHLAPDSNVLFSADGGNTDMDKCFYELSNVYLTAEAVVPDPRQSVAPSQTFEFNSISSYFTTFNSANAIINFNLGLSRVLGVFGNMVPAKMINNIQSNGLSNNYPQNSGDTAADINQIFFLRGGEKFPVEYNIDTIQKDTPANVTGDSQVVQEYMNAIQKFSAISRTTANPMTVKVSDSSAAVMNTRIDGGSVFGIGVAYDVISGNGVDFRTQNFGINMDVGIDTDSPQALYLFVHSKQTLAFSSNGIQIMK
tara:strand:+ start:7321 stop:8655 length:1335 start_codon:yes stop_codon:yes gene_type:complete